MRSLLPLRPFLALVACAALALGATACGGEEDQGSADRAEGGAPTQAETPAPDGATSGAEAPTEVVGGRTVLKLNDTLRRALDVAGVTVEPVGAAEAVPGGIAFPIRSGRVDLDTPSGRIEHAGGIRFSAGGREVTARNLVLLPGKDEVTAEIAGRRVPLMSTKLAPPKVPPTGDVVVLPATVSLGGPASRVLSDRLGVDVFDAGLKLGRLTASAKRP
jgi:hypothetical protein